MGNQLAEVRRQLENELAELSRIHDQWKRKIQDQVEKPLRDSLDKSDWQRWGQVERQLGDDVKEYESLVDKLSKVFIFPLSFSLSLFGLSLIQRELSLSLI